MYGPYARAANDVRQQLQICTRHNQFRAAAAVRTAHAGAYARPMHLECPRALQALLHDQAAALCSHDVRAEATSRGWPLGGHDGELPVRRHVGASLKHQNIAHLWTDIDPRRCRYHGDTARQQCCDETGERRGPHYLCNGDIPVPTADGDEGLFHGWPGALRLKDWYLAVDYDNAACGTL